MTGINGLAGLDFATITGYFILVVVIGIYASCRATTSNSKGYFLAGRSSNWLLIGASTFATNVGAQMFIGLAGSAALSGIAVVMFEWHAMFMLILQGWVFLPVYRSSGCFTMPEYLRMRYGGQRIRMWIAISTTIVTIVSTISGQIYAGSLFLSVVFDWNLYGSIIFVLIVTALFTLLGGLTTVLWTDTLQTFILVGTSLFVSAISMTKVGGYMSMKEQYLETTVIASNVQNNYSFIYNTQQNNSTIIYSTLQNNSNVFYESQQNSSTCAVPPENSFHIFRSHDDGTFPWPGMVFGLTILALSFWCTDQTCVQRSLSAKSITHAKAGLLFAAYLKVTSFWFFVIPGMVGRVLFSDQVGCSDPVSCDEICKNPRGCSNIAYPLLVRTILPIGLKGLMLAAMLSALMSSLTSSFNSSSTIFTMDIWRFFRPRARESELMVVGRIWTLFLMFVGIGWLPILMMLQGTSYWNYTQSIYSCIVPANVVVFLSAVFWRRATEEGAFWTLVVGFCCGVTRMLLAWTRNSPPCGSDEPNTQFAVVRYVHYLHFAIIEFVVCVIVMIIVSLLTKPRPDNKLHKRTWWNRNDDEFPEESEESDVETDTTQYEQAKGILFYFCKWGCGVDTSIKRRQISRDEKKEVHRRMTSLQENPKWRIVLNINMVICAGVAVFLHAYFA